MLQTLVQSPQPGHRHTHTLIFLHGPSDHAARFSETLLNTTTPHSHTNIPTAFPSFRLVFPQAPDRHTNGAPNAAPQPLWFDDVESAASKRYSRLPVTSPPSGDSSAQKTKDRVTIDTLRDILPELRELLKNEAALLGNRWDKIVLAGISMGGAAVTELFLTLNIPREGGGRLGAVLLFASWAPLPDLYLTQLRDALGGGLAPRDEVVIRNTPVLIEHCRDDHVVNIDKGRQLKNMLKSFGAEVTWREYNEGRHWFGQPDGLHDAISFIEKRVVGAKKVKERGIKSYIASIFKRLFR